MQRVLLDRSLVRDAEEAHAVVEGDNAGEEGELVCGVLVSLAQESSNEPTALTVSFIVHLSMREHVFVFHIVTRTRGVLLVVMRRHA